MLLYLGDSWKIKPNFSLTYGLRCDRDTGRTDSHYPAIPGINGLMPGLGNEVNQPNQNLAPQLGFAWDPSKTGKTSIRGGIGLFYENAIWNNVLFDGPFRETTGAFLQTPTACSAPGAPATIQVPISAAAPLGTLIPSSGGPNTVCGTSSGAPLIGNALPAILALQAQYQALSPLNLHTPNPAYVGVTTQDCVTNNPGCFFPPGSGSMFNPDYISPRSVQMNIGIQHELRRGMVFSTDFVRNVQTHYLLGVDQNHTGDIRYFNQGGAKTAIANTLALCGVSSINAAAQNCPTNPDSTDQTGYTPRPANMGDFATNGLGSSSDMGGGSCLSVLGYPCAFGGINPSAPPLGFLSPVGRSVYDGLQMKLTDNVKEPFKGATGLNFTVSYSLSRFDNTGGGVIPDGTVTASSGDQDFIVPSLDNANVNRYFGPSTLDRTHQISSGGTWICATGSRSA